MTTTIPRSSIPTTAKKKPVSAVVAAVLGVSGAASAPAAAAAPGPVCPRQRDACVDRLLVSMERSYARLDCDHSAAFALLYWRTTEGIRDAIRAGEFSDRPFWNQITTAFGLGAIDHDDHLHVNTVLARISPVAYAEIVAKLDPTLTGQRPDDPALELDVFAWRELAWTNAARLAAAPDVAGRRAVAAEIERNSIAMARRIKAAFRATGAANQARNAFCRQAQSAAPR